MRVGSLFSGIGGLDEGLERAGMTTKWQCESDPFCQEILRRRFPHVKHLYPDATKLTSKIARFQVDVLTGGFPCQPVSVAGDMWWEDDERWLWPVFLRVIQWCEPNWVVIENVEGIRTRGLDQILRSLADSGYDAEWDRLSAQAFGAPHQRQRYFIIAYPCGSFRGNMPCVYRKPSLTGKAFYENCHIRSRRLYGIGRKEVEKVRSPFGGFGWWRFEPDLDRMGYGIPDLVDRHRAIGNAVVPQVAEWLGRRIMEVENG